MAIANSSIANYRPNIFISYLYTGANKTNKPFQFPSVRNKLKLNTKIAVSANSGIGGGDDRFEDVTTSTMVCWRRPQRWHGFGLVFGGMGMGGVTFV